MDREEWMSSLKDKITGAAGVAKKKSEELVEITRIKFVIMDAEGEIKKLLADIGALIYEARKNESEIDESLTDKCEQIDTLYAEIAEAQARLDALKNLKSCASCGAKVAAGSEFCSACGTKIEE